MQPPVVFAGSLVVLMSIAGPASAQRPPVRGLLGTTDRTAMDASISVYGGLDQTRRHDRVGTLARRRDNGGRHGGLTAGVSLKQPLGGLSFNVSGSGSLQYYPGPVPLDLVDHNTQGTISIAAPVGRRASVSLTQTVSEASFYNFDGAAGTTIRALDDFERPSSDSRLGEGRSLRYDLGGRLDRRLGRTGTLGFEYGLGYATFPGDAIDFAAQHGGIRFEHAPTRDLSFRWGYAYERGRSGPGPSHDLHRLDIGPTYRKPLTLSRRTTLTATAGAAAVTVQTDAEARLVLRLIAAVSLGHQLGRTWSLSADYRREPQMDELYRNPTSADAISLALRGAASRRLSLTMMAGAWRTRLDAGRGPVGYQSLFGSASTRIVLAGAMGLLVEYSYYDFDASSAPASGVVASRLGRHSVRAGLNWSLPLLTSTQ
ncbi:MAG: hypothetical protein IT176_03245 [Acidobacteria bacterium]|nr:hypothetical protein [Acidobacteriota bacterium]